VDWKFDDPELERLYTKGKSSKYQLDRELTKKFSVRVQQIEAARDVNDLQNIPSLKFKAAPRKKSGKFFTVSLDNNHHFLVELRSDKNHIDETLIVILELYQ
jgi:plasmid maintenance system killer protein